METLQKKIERILISSLKGCQTDLETLPNGHVCSDVISPEFDGMSYENRYRRLRRILDENLPEEERGDIGTLLTYTPQEWSYVPEKS